MNCKNIIFPADLADRRRKFSENLRNLPAGRQVCGKQHLFQNLMNKYLVSDFSYFCTTLMNKNSIQYLYAINIGKRQVNACITNKEACSIF
jgi:hypothetical protein